MEEGFVPKLTESKITKNNMKKHFENHILEMERMGRIFINHTVGVKNLDGYFQVQDFLPLPEDSSVRGVDVSTVPSKSYVPRTAGPTRF